MHQQANVAVPVLFRRPPSLVFAAPFTPEDHPDADVDPGSFDILGREY